MANTTVSIRERIKTDGQWRWSAKISIPKSKLSPAEAERKGIFYLVWTENGDKREQAVEERRFEAAVKADHIRALYPGASKSKYNVHSAYNHLSAVPFGVARLICWSAKETR